MYCARDNDLNDMRHSTLCHETIVIHVFFFFVQVEVAKKFMIAARILSDLSAFRPFALRT